MLNKLKLLLAAATLGTVATTNATVGNVRAQEYQMFHLDSSKKANGTMQRLSPYTDENGFIIWESGWATNPKVTNIVVPTQITVQSDDPDFAGTYTITNIAYHAFQCYTDVNDRSYDPDRLEFINCVKTVSLPSTITTIADEVFQNCGSLVSVNVPSSVTTMGSNVFENCSSLTNVDFQANLTSGILPNYTFKGCSSLKEVTLPASITNLGFGAFAGCSNLQKITVKGSSLAYAGDAFDGVNLSGVTVVVPAGQAANFENLKELGATVKSEVTPLVLGKSFADGKIQYRVTSVDPAEAVVRAFGDKSYYGPVNIPQTVEYQGNIISVVGIMDNVFDLCAGITSVTLPEGLREIGSSAFSRCTLLENINLPSTLTKIGSAAFEGTLVTSFVVPEGVTNLPNGVFQGCGELTEVEIKGDISVLNNLMFRDCTKLQKVTLPASLTYLGDGVFTNCTSLSEIVFNGPSIGLSTNALTNATFVANVGWQYTPIDLSEVVIVIPDAASLSGYEDIKDLVAFVKTPDGTVIYGEDPNNVDRRYFAGTPIKNASELQDGGLYFLNVAFRGDRNKDGYMVGIEGNTNGQYARYAGEHMTEIPAEGMDVNGLNNTNYVWKIVGTPEGFKVQCVGAGGYWLSRQGAINISKNNIKAVSSPDDEDAAIFALESIPEGAAYSANTPEHTHFWFRLTNATWPDVDGRGENVCLMSNGTDTSAENVAYWNYNTKPQGYLQIELVPAVVREVAQMNITVKLPAINGTEVADQTLEVLSGMNVEAQIKEILANLGGMAKPTITGEDGTLIPSKTNRVFTVTGHWDKELIANHVYRICLKPSDKPAAMRYDAVDDRVKTTVDYNEETFNSLVPERLWYFVPVEGKPGVYTLHTMADQTKGIYIEDSHDSQQHIAYAMLSDDTNAPTEFKFGVSTWNGAMMGDFNMTYGANNRNYLNDRGNYLANWTSSAGKGDAGSTMRLYPILAEDLEVLGLDPSTEPTVDNLSQAVKDFNDVNVSAALRRVRYFGATLIGPYVGQYDNENDNAYEMYQKALTLADDASDEEKAEIVSALDVTKLKFRELVANRFYRFKNKTSNLYISSISSSTIKGRAYMDLTADNTRSNTVFYYAQNGEDDYTLVCFDNGLVMPSFNSTNWVPVLKTDADAAKGTKLTYQNNGCYLIHVSGTDSANIPHRHLYGAGNTQNNAKIVDCAGNNTGNDYQWYVEPVKELPVTLYNVTGIDGYTDQGWSSIYSPVALEIPAESGLTAYNGTFNGEIVEPAKVGENAVVPANHTTILYYNGEGSAENSEMAGRQHISYINLPIVYEAEAAGETAGNLGGGIYAIAKAADTKYFTLHESHSNNFREYTGNYIPGFKAYIAQSAADAAELYPITMDPEKLTPLHEVISVEKNLAGTFDVTIVMPHSDCEVYFKHTLPEEKAARRAADHTGYDMADNVEGNTHTFTVPAGVVNYYGYHPDTDSKGVERAFTINADGSTTGLQGIVADKAAAQCYDLQGRRLAAPVKGINIVNNKKVLVK